MSIAPLGQEWFAYYEEFPYFNSEFIREGCHPRIAKHSGSVDQSVVLVHGLTDSPHYMMEIARFFHESLGYNVYIPILQCHGLKQPKGMEGVNVEEWKKNVRFAVEQAALDTPKVSIGGLSTGGTLSVYTASYHASVNGALFLFSAALDLAGGLLGEVKERILRTPLVDFVDAEDRNRSLIGENPYRYNRIDKGAARQLAYLMKEIDRMIKKRNLGNLLNIPAFAAHSESDTTASIEGIKKLKALYTSQKFTFQSFPKKMEVSHASLVLKHPIYKKGQYGIGEPLEKANPFFDDMMESIRAFVQ